MNGNDDDLMQEDEIVIENDAIFTIVDDKLIVIYGGNRNVVMELETEAEAELCKQVLADPNFWANFLGSLSGALKRKLSN